MSAKTMDMTKGPLFTKILKLSVPMILTGILQLLFSTADLIVIGQFAGSDSLAAVGATTSLNHLIINLVLGLSVGANVLMSQAIGAKNRDKAERTVHTSMTLALVSARFSACSDTLSPAPRSSG
ncbi:MAG: MATE family efflux transporter [Christensenellales bacterium]